MFQNMLTLFFMAPWNRGALLPNNKELFCFIEISSSDELDIEI